MALIKKKLLISKKKNWKLSAISSFSMRETLFPELKSQLKAIKSQAFQIF